MLVPAINGVAVDDSCVLTVACQACGDARVALAVARLDAEIVLCLTCDVPVVTRQCRSCGFDPCACGDEDYT